MGADRTEAKGREPRQEKKKLGRGFGLLAVLGVILVLAGLVGLVYTSVATLTSMFLFGWLLLIGGVVGLLQAVQSRKSNYFWLAVIVAAINIAAGFVILRRPEASAEALTMFAALLFLTGGLFRLVGSLVVRGSNFGLALVQGAFGVLLGILILSNWPGNSLYVIGTFFSLALLFDGLSLVALGLGARRILGLVREDEVSAEAGAMGGASGTAEKRPAEDQEQSNS
ncbi:HdeD family acid-resistance protein [Streptomyces antarcticus]|uniref:HdeD family acid-resistance protein n=1 Tax=Streptomyces antarcticus TaxID=2996458 RepID=UPI002270B963|nr:MULTISPECIES: HdeD family acid-resistance protein [unclassified Streptomyces]MCY0940405.1 HdeD family acid-resistance protein [Streptomyces sp. H34-AA3]MCZ4083919.1 HdeD family acid-resistance protein [Streptomyces sp. H34-S5]